MLTKENMQQILDEEKYRQEIRKSLDEHAVNKHRNLLFDFLNSTFFLAVLSSFVIPFLISDYQARAQKLKEKEALERKIANERAEIKNRIDIISRIDTAGVTGEDYAEIKNAFRGFDSTGGFSVSEEFTKRNIYSLLSDYRYDLDRTEGKDGNDSIKSRLPEVTDALQKGYNYLKSLYPFMYGATDTSDVIKVDKNDAIKNPAKVDIFTSGYHDLNYQFYYEVLPELRKFK